MLALLNMLWMRKLLLIGTFVMGVLCAGFYAFAIAEPQYFSVARMAFEVRQQKLIDLDNYLPGASTESEAINTELEIVRSNPLLTTLVVQENLLEDPDFNPMLTPPSVWQLSTWKERVKSLLGMGEVVQEPTEQDIMNATVERVREAVRVSAQRDTYLFNIGVISKQPDKAVTLANALAQIYIDNQIEVKFSSTEYAVNWLSQRVTELEGDLQASEAEMKQLRESSDLISREALDALTVRSKALRDRLQEAASLVAEQQTTLELITPLVAERNYIGILDVVDDRVLREILARDGRPSQLEDRARALIGDLQNSIEATRSREEALRLSLDKLQTEIDAQTEDFVKLNTLVRDVEANRVLYETFLTRLKETSIQMGLQRPNSRVLSSATSTQLLAPRKGVILSFGGVLGFLIGLSLVLMRFFVSGTFREASDLERYTGYPVLGQLPTLPIRKRMNLLSYISDNPTSAMAEAVRNLRTSLLMQEPEHPPQVIMLSSSLPSESKTTTSIYLSKNMADLGQRVLLIEADNRRLTFAEYFPSNTESNLLTVMDDTTTLADSVSQTQFGFDLLLGAKSSINAADLFSSRKFAELIQKAREDYEIILIDTPPVLVVPDARIVARVVDAVLYLVAWDSTPKIQVENGLREFSFVGAPIFGTVMTKIDRKRASQYGYGGYGGYQGNTYYDT